MKFTFTSLALCSVGLLTHLVEILHKRPEATIIRDNEAHAYIHACPLLSKRYRCPFIYHIYCVKRKHR